MIQKLYLDKGEPFVSEWPEKLSDGSTAWEISFRGGAVLNCLDEKRADKAFALIAAGIEVAIGDKPLIL